MVDFDDLVEEEMDNENVNSTTKKNELHPQAENTVHESLKPELIEQTSGSMDVDDLVELEEEMGREICNNGMKPNSTSDIHSSLISVFDKLI